MPSDVPEELKKSGGDEKVLDMTEEELDMFKEEHKAEDDNVLVNKPPPSSDSSDIVVSYGESTPPVKSKLSRARLPGQIAATEYSTVAEIERAERKKEKKKIGKKEFKTPSEEKA